MELIWLYSIVSVAIVSLISFIGIAAFFIRKNQLNNILVYLISFSAGALFGDAFLHLLPEAVRESGFGLNISLSVLSGIGVFFVIEKCIHWRHCHLPITNGHRHPFAWMNLFGDAVHNFIDGLIIGASYVASVPVGIATTVAVVLHEIPQEIGDFGILVHGGFSHKKALLLNFATALTSVLGVIIALLIGSQVENMTLFLIPFAAGGFIYIAGSDLIPEMHKECAIDISLMQIASVVAGVLVMVALRAVG